MKDSADPARVPAAAGARALDDGQSVEPFSRDVLLQYLDGDVAVLCELADILERDGPRLLRAIEAGAASEDTKGVGRAGHELIGVLLNLQATHAAGLARELELAAKSERWGDVRRKYAQLSAELPRIATALRT